MPAAVVTDATVPVVLSTDSRKAMDQLLSLMIERKASGEEITAAPEAPAPAKVPDLMAALEASLAAVRSDDDDKPKRKSSSKSSERETSKA